MSQPPPEAPACVFDEVYHLDLVYVPGCWQLCGDAHCCSFARHKARFRLLARTPFQELPLLPGEHDWLVARGWHRQFEPYEHRVVEFALEGLTLRAELIVSERPGCACNHATRPTICRLYPLLPVFDDGGRVTDVEPMGIYEEMERIAGMEPACQVRALPFEQMPVFLAMARALGAEPWIRFHLEAYRRAKRHVASRLAARHAEGGRDVFQLFEAGFLRHTLVDAPSLRAELGALLAAYDAREAPGWRPR